MNDLTGKIAIVIGASKGIGVAIAQGLAAAGAAVKIGSDTKQVRCFHRLD